MTADATNLLAAIRGRRTIKPKSLKPDAVDESLVETVLEAARWAPSHGRTEPWRFVVFTGEGRRALGDAISAGYSADSRAQGNYTEEAFAAARDRVWGVPVWIAILMQPGQKPDGTRAFPESEEICAVACAVQNLHLTACALGLGGMWSTGGALMHTKVQELIGVEKPSVLLGFFMLGWPLGEWPTATRKPVAEFVRWCK